MSARRFSACFLFVVSMVFCGWSQSRSSSLAATPPMGWNSWDAYGLTITESQFRQNVAVLVRERALGWKYAVIDEGWYMQNPLASKAAAQQFVLDGNGRRRQTRSLLHSRLAGRH